MNEMTPAQRLGEAFRVYLERQDREAHPAGRKNPRGVWHPSSSERRGCCEGIRTPSPLYPWGLMLHCRTMRHVARLYDVPLVDLRRMARAATRRAPAA